MCGPAELKTTGYRNMIINTGQRTDIPAFYSEWFANRLREGFVCVRNPYDPSQVSRYRLDPSVVDAIGFCTKNPEPMFRHMDLLEGYGQYWFVTITPYGRDIEPNVPDKHHMLDVFTELSRKVGIDSVGWRYDPIFVSARYTPEYHLRAFERMASELDGCTRTAVISFIDLFPKVRRNFPEAIEVPDSVKTELGREMVKIASRHGMTLKPCAECACYLACDIGAYNTCRHLCRYCYANADPSVVLKRSRDHDPSSPFLVGNYMDGDRIHDVPQESWTDAQAGFFE